MQFRPVTRLAALAAAVLLVVAACGGGSAAEEATTDDPASQTPGFAASVASYEQVAGEPQRFIVGITGPDGHLVAYGSMELSFAYLGTRDNPVEDPEATVSATAEFLPVPGHRLDAAQSEPTLVAPSDATGVYGAYDVVLPEPGFWEVRVRGEVEGKDIALASAFEVHPEPRLPFPGDPAPRTQNPVWGAPGVEPKAIDSRAQEGGDDPAPELHRTVIADAIAAGRPVLVVVSTPVYCKSRFCGPITDMVQQLARKYGDRMDFVHLELYKDFERNAINAAAAEWVVTPDRGSASEPWTFLVGPDGTIVERWDNVASESEVTEAIEEMLAA